MRMPATEDDGIVNRGSKRGGGATGRACMSSEGVSERDHALQLVDVSGMGTTWMSGNHNVPSFNSVLKVGGERIVL